jgi:hypothetical protein
MRTAVLGAALCLALGCGLRPPAKPELPGTCLSVTTDLPADPYDRWLFEPPPLVVLTAEEAASGGMYLLDEVPGSLPTPHPFKTWRMRGLDSLELSWANGAQGVRVVLPLHGDTTLGRAITLDHMVHEDSGSGGSAVGIRRSCDAEVPPWYRRTRAKIAVDLADGSFVEVGMPVPVHWPSAETHHGQREAPVNPRGVFEGAHGVYVAEKRGRVDQITLVYADSTRYQYLLSSLTQTLGQPDHTHDFVGWRDRELTLTFGRSRDEPSGFYVRYTHR